MDQPQTMSAGIPSLYQRSVGNLLNRLNMPFPFYLNDDRKNLMLVSVISVFVTVFLYAFKTPSESNFAEGIEWLHGIITFGCLCFNILVLPKLFPSAMDPVHWTYKKYITLNIGHLLLIDLVCTLIEKPIYCPDKTWLFVGSHVSTQVALKLDVIKTT